MKQSVNNVDKLTSEIFVDRRLGKKGGKLQ